MKLKIKISTPKGQAKKAEKRIKKLVLGFRGKNRVGFQSFSNKEDSLILWELEGQVRDLMKISKNAMRFNLYITSILNNKLVGRTLRKKLSEDDQEELRRMLQEGTTVEVIKEATAEEIVEGNLTMWERVKRNFQRQKD